MYTFSPHLTMLSFKSLRPHTMPYCVTHSPAVHSLALICGPPVFPLGIWPGVQVQRGNTKMMLHSVAKLVAYVSTIFTLEPGDVILTGTPEGVGPIVAGDSLKAGITGIIEMAFEVKAKTG